MIVAQSPFAHPRFRAAWIATLCSNIGGLIQLVGASWMMVSLGASAQMVALVQTSASLPVMLLSLWAGAVADNLDRRRVLLAAQVFMLSVSALLAIAAWLGWVTPLLLLACTFLIGCGTAVNAPAWHAFVGDALPREVLRSAVAVNSMSFNIARSTGPAIGGLLIAMAGAAAAFTTNAASYIGLIVVLKRWRVAPLPHKLPRERLLFAMGAGIRYAWMSPPIRIILARTALYSVAATAIAALMPVVARDLIGGGPLMYGLLFGMFGVGGVCGAVSAHRIGQQFSTERIIQWSAVTVASGAAATAVGTLTLVLPALVLAGGGWVLALSTFNASVQLAAPRWVAARAVALFQMATFGGVAAGSSLFGAIASAHNITVALLCAAGALLLSIVAGLLFPIPEVGQLNLDPQNTWIEPEMAHPLATRSGPIVIAVEHQIADADVPAFLNVMSERRRIRIRDGARNWTLWHDLAESTLWVERFDFATWLDYVRHNRRRTWADGDNTDALRRLWIDGRIPTIRRFVELRTEQQVRRHAPDSTIATL
ncbi:putative MFS family arabinose efflux permease [Hephaestia caeni]|uniref:Putative MFS family arabinose efflux permease n=1 Tax=Hephaestia caeni TaxID=645617 RepID=A0A397P7I2_9SPHN|nr:MFS transporter [Hephaestia caeni]RIA45506.1 putative MFS family arabinose efflux permease [Hephaestia caeni]